jgi:uncharacterized protein YqgV (UPF0045/DUF77 family)
MSIINKPENNSKEVYMTTINISLVNTGSERVNMSVAIDGNTKDGNQVTVSRKVIETLRQALDMGKNFNAPADKVEETLASRLKGFPNGEEVIAYLSTKGVTVTDYVNSAIATLATSKIKEPTTRAKRGEGAKTKQVKFAISSAVKLACRFAPASETGEVTSEMLLAGFTAALDTLKDLDTDEVVAAAMKLAQAKGLDEDGYVRLRGGNSEEESE